MDARADATVDATGDATVDATVDAEASLLSDALDVPQAAVTTVSREPLGAGTVAGFVLTEAAAGLPAGTVAYVDSSLLPVAQETGLVLEGEARVWVHPADPHLPALAPAAFGDATEVLLRRLGLTASALPEMIGYRPGRRAVLRVATTEGVAWVKVVRPSRIERVVTAHDALRGHGLPVPAVRGWSPEGLLVLDSARGAAATEAPWEPDGLLDAVADLRERLATAPVDWPARTSLARRLPWYLGRLAAAMPARGDVISGIGSRIDAALAETPAEDVTIHGDLHIGQLFLDGPAVIGLIDVDTAGRGEAGEDAAAFIGHAAASALLTEQQGRDATRVRALARAAYDRWGEEPRTRALTGVHLLGHALGAAAGGDAERAGILLDAADRVSRGPALADSSGGDHAEPKRPLMAVFEGL